MYERDSAETEVITSEPVVQRRDYARYLVRRLRPAFRALMLVALCGYLAATMASALAEPTSIPLAWRLAPALPILLISLFARDLRQPLTISVLALVCIAMLEVGVNLNGIGRVHGLSWVMPGSLLIPVAASIISPTRWDFTVAMGLCTLGPLPMLLLGDADGMQTFQFVVYMAISTSLAAVLRTFMTRTLQEQFQLEQRLREQASTDGLTGLMVRNHFLQSAHALLAAAQSRRRAGCMLYLDADRFKQLNDKHGHAAGDAALIALADVLRREMRASDPIGRLGGEEFAVLLPDLDLREAIQRAERLRLAVHTVQRPDGPLTVSIGVAQSRPNEAIDSLLARADQAMRQAKTGGRDQVVQSQD